MGDMDYYQKYIKQEQEDFMKVLEKYFPSKRYENPRVLGICCGVANEEHLLKKYFGKKTEFVGFDNNDYLKERLAKLRRKPIINADIRNLEKFVKGKFEIIMGRNIPLNPNHSTWEEVDDHWPVSIENLKHYMTQRSLFFLTLARGDEFNRAMEIMNNSGYNIRVSEINPIRVQSDYLGIIGADTKDNYVIVADIIQNY